MGKKYIIELLDDCQSEFKGIIVFGLTPTCQISAEPIPVEDLTPYTAPDLEQVRKEAYEKGYDDATAEIGSDEQAIAEKAYQQGLSDAWEAARKIANMTDNERLEVIGTFFVCRAFCKNTATEVIKEIRAYEQAQKEKEEQEEQIQVGDVVTPRETEYDDMIVTRSWKDDYDSDCIDAIGFDGRIGSFLVSSVSKTGKHYEIASVLEKMRGEQDV